MRPKPARNGLGICPPTSIQKLNQPTKQNPAEIRRGLSAVWARLWRAFFVVQKLEATTSATIERRQTWLIARVKRALTYTKHYPSRLVTSGA
jgi:hypothetical protein